MVSIQNALEKEILSSKVA
jgi:hypothetical protein